MDRPARSGTPGTLSFATAPGAKLLLLGHDPDGTLHDLISLVFYCVAHYIDERHSSIFALDLTIRA